MYHFHPVVVFWVMACSNDNTTIKTIVIGGEVDLLCSTSTYKGHVDAALP